MEQPVTVRYAREIAQSIHELGVDLDEAVRVLAEAKLAGGRVAESQAALTTARADLEAVRRDQAAVLGEMEAERARARDAITAYVISERARIEAVLEAERGAVARLQEEHAALDRAMEQARRSLVEAREASAVAIAEARRDGEAARQQINGALAAMRRELGEVTERVEAKRKEYQALIEQVKAVLRG